ncbi:hypothetical protein TanjilG_19285 [Lupinus angustifolius]|uniref:Uncharacterized protein n=1 Tax=Lupinus angustifolius TaxID=3871 RepID=A0A1J7H4B0_LUPAN|nr:PREDICTED: protein RETICULATA-RELATED 3, chloroplastic-like [Lupinus angustifolius]OIW07444.1 hypothetical protein TanjilG_19285 [Lupinus angustifolius]
MAQLRFSPHFHHTLSQHNNNNNINNNTLSLPFPSSPQRLHLHNNNNNNNNPSLFLTNQSSLSSQSFKLYSSSGGGGNNSGGNGGGGGNNGGDHNNDENLNDPSPDSSLNSGFGILGLFLEGWRSRVKADPQFPFKVLMEEIVGVTACVLGDMASRPNFGLNELDLVFSTLVVGSIINFTVMYLLAPTSSSLSTTLPSIFATCPKSHMFEPGSFSVLDRFGTLAYKGSIFAVVGLAAGLVGTLLSNGLMKMRAKFENNKNDDFEKVGPTIKSPPIVLNALTWAIHMGLSSNLRYQSLNGVELMLERGLRPLAFKSSVLVLRLVNNVVGGVSFVLLARLTGAQSVGEQDKKDVEVVVAEEKYKLLLDGDKRED